MKPSNIFTASVIARSPAMKSFKLRLITRFAIALAALAPVYVSHAADNNPPTKLTHQGFLTDANGVPLGNTAPVNKTIIFRIWDAASGGNRIWSSTQVVTVDKGHYSVLLGEGSAQGSETFSADLTSVFTGTGASDRFLEITVDGTALAPRLQFLPAPYAMLAKQVTDTAVTESKIAANAVTTAKITDGNVTEAKLAANAVTAAKLAANAVTTAKIADGNVTGAKLGANAVTTAKITDGNVTEAKLAANAVTTAKITDGNVTAAKLAADAVTTAKIAGAAVTADKLATTLTKLTFDTSRFAPPDAAGSSAGMKLNLVGGYAMGVEAGYLWQQAPLSADNGFKWYGGTSNKMVLRNGRLGIGTDDPSCALHVAASGNTATMSSTGSGKRMLPSNFALNEGGTTATATIGLRVDGGGIIAHGAIYVADGITVSSDRRIKKVEGVSSSVIDLQLLRGLKVTDYLLIDHSKGSARHKMLIAQDVMEVFPQAVSVSPMPETIPNVYEMAKAVDYHAAAGRLRVATGKPHEFKVGDKVDLYTEDAPLKAVKVEVVNDPHMFEVSSDKPVKSVFVYGKQVNDFLTVDYDAIAMLNVSATQELARRNEKLAAENESLILLS